MSEIVFASLGTDLVIGDDVFEDVPPPSVREAITILGLTGDVIEDESSRGALYRALRSWLPEPTYKRIEALSLSEVLGNVLALIKSYIPTGKKIGGETGSQGASRLDEVWDDLILEYVRFTGSSIRETLAEGFGVFMATCDMIDRAEARRQLQESTVISIPHMTAEGRTALIDKLLIRAGLLTPEEIAERKLEEQKRNLESFLHMQERGLK